MNQQQLCLKFDVTCNGHQVYILVWWYDGFTLYTPVRSQTLHIDYWYYPPDNGHPQSLSVQLDGQDLLAFPDFGYASLHQMIFAYIMQGIEALYACLDTCRKASLAERLSIRGGIE